MLTHDLPALVLTDTLSVPISPAMAVDADVVECAAGRQQNEDFFFFKLCSSSHQNVSILTSFNIRVGQ